MPCNQLGYVMVTSLEISVYVEYPETLWCLYCISTESFFFFLYYAAADIVKYLFKEYGAGRQPSPGLLERLANQSISLVTMDMIENISMEFFFHNSYELDI